MNFAALGRSGGNRGSCRLAAAGEIGNPLRADGFGVHKVRVTAGELLPSILPSGDYFEVRDQALMAHATQIDPEGGWFVCPRDVQRAAWPTEDFHLARSVVDTEKPETDLFAGVRESLRCEVVSP